MTDPRRQHNPLLVQWLILAAALAVTAIAVGYARYGEYGDVRWRAKEQLSAVSKVVAVNVDQNLVAISTVLAGMAREAARGAGGTDYEKHLAELDEAMPGVSGLAIRDASGNLLASSRSGLAASDVSEYDFRRAPQRHPETSAVYVSEQSATLSGARELRISREIRGRDGKAAGLVTATLDPTYYAELLDALCSSPGMAISLQYGDDVVFQAASRVQDSLGGRSLAAGDGRLMVRSDVKSDQWHADKPLGVVVSLAESEAYGSWRRSLFASSAGFLAAALALALGLYAYQRRQLGTQSPARAEAEPVGERFLAMITDNIPVMVAYWTRDLRCTFVNDRWSEWFGKTSAQMRDTRLPDLLGEAAYRDSEPCIRQALSGRRQEIEQILPKADGSAGHTWTHYIPDVDGANEVRGFIVVIADIERLKRTEAALAESESTLRTIVATEPECVKVLAPDGTLVRMNRAGLDMIEADSEEQVVGAPVDRLVTEEYRAAFLDLNRRVNAGESGSLVFELVGLKGRHRWLDTRAVPMRNADGAIVGLLGVTRDITEQKLATDAVRLSEERLNRAEIISKTGNWELYLDTQTVTASKGAASIYGFAGSRIELKAAQRLVIAEDRPRLDVAIHDLLVNKSLYDVEFQIRTPAGELKFIRSAATFDEDKGIVFGVIQDITERKRSEKALVESEARFRNIFEDNGSVLLLIEPGSGSIVDANSAAARYYGYPLPTLVGMNIEQLNTMPAEEVAAERERAVHEERNYFNFGHRLASGEVRDVEVYSTPVDVRGDVFLLSIVHDITARKRAEKALLESELFAKATIDAVSEQICVLDRTGRILAVNQAWRDVHDKNDLGRVHADYFVGANYLEVCHLAVGPDADNAARIAQGIREVIDGRRNLFEMEYACHGPHEQRWFLGRVTRFPGESGNVVIAHEDVTDHVLSRNNLMLAASVFTHAREGIAITDAEARLIDVNDAFTRITGYGKDEVYGLNPRLLKSNRQSAEFYEAMWRSIIDDGFWFGELWNRRKDGEIYPELMSISAVKDDQGRIQNYVSMFTDISVMKEYQQQLEHIAHYDCLTNLPNRVLLAILLRQAMASCSRRGRFLAVAFIDLDGFKEVNDQYGHDVGDKFLVGISQRMKEALREGDTLARIGGDEFVAVLSDLERPSDFERVIVRLLMSAAASITVSDIVLRVSASVGVTLYPEDKGDADQLVRHADQAMYQAKQAGKNCYRLFDR